MGGAFKCWYVMMSKYVKKDLGSYLDYSGGNKLFTSGAVGIAKLELARGIRKTLNTTVVKPYVLIIPNMLLDPMLITSMTDGIKFEMPRALSKRFATKFSNKHPV